MGNEERLNRHFVPRHRQGGMVHRRGRRFMFPDGTERYLVDESMLLEWTRRLGGILADPLTTTIRQDQRCMTAWVVRKAA